MRLDNNILNTISAGFLCTLLSTSAMAADTEIKHKALAKAIAGERQAISASVEDPAGVELVRAYFKALEAKDYSFVVMNKEGGSYKGVIPAPANGSQAFDYLLLVKNGNNEVVKSQAFRVDVEDSDNEVAAADKVQVYTELAQAPSNVTGFADNIALDVVESAAKYGVVAGLMSSSSAGGAGVATATGASSAGTVAATAGISMGVVAGAAVAVGAAAGGGGSSSSSTTPTTNPDQGGLQGGSGEVRANLTWDAQNIDIDLHLEDPCGNEIFFGRPSVTCNGRQGVLDVDDVDGGPGSAENITWPNGAPRGSYRVGINHFDGNSSASYQVKVFYGANTRTFSGTLAPNESKLIHSFSF